MHFLHSTLSSSANLASIVVLDSKTSDNVEVLLSYPMKIELGCMTPTNYTTDTSLYIESSYLWIEGVSDGILAFSSNFSLLLLGKQFPFPKIKEIKLKKQAIDGKPLFAYGKNHVCLVFEPSKAHFVNIETSEVFIKSYSRLSIEDVAFSTQDDTFVFMLKPTTKGKVTHKIVIYDPNDHFSSSKPSPAPSYLGFVKSDTDYAIIKANSIEYNSNAVSVSNIREHSRIVDNIIVYQTNEPELVVLNLETSAKLTITDAPQFADMWIIKKFIVVKEENLKCHVFVIPDQITNSALSFRALGKYLIPNFAGFNTVFDYQGNIALSGEIGAYVIKPAKESIKDENIQDSEFIVKADGIYSRSNQLITEFDSSATASAVLNNKILTAHDPCYLTLFNETLMHREDVTIDLPANFNIIAVALSYSHIAVGISETNSIQNCVRGHIILMNSSFQRCGGDVRLPSAVRTMEFSPLGDELIVHCTNGIALSCCIKRGLIDSVKLIYPNLMCPRVNINQNSIKENEESIMKTLISRYSKCLSSIKKIPYHNTSDDQFFNGLQKMNSISSQETLPAGNSFVTIEDAKDDQTKINFNGKSIILKRVSGICSTLIKRNRVVVVTTEKLINVYNDSLLLLHSTPLPDEPTGMVTLGRTIIILFKNHTIAARLYPSTVKFHRARMNCKTSISLVIVNNEYIWSVDDENVVSVIIYDRQSDRFELVSKRQLPVDVNCIAPLDDLSVSIGCNDGSILVVRIPMEDAIGCGTCPSVLEIVWKANIRASIESISRVNRKIVYLTNEGSVGVLKPLGCLEDSEEILDAQDQVRDIWSNECGFSLPDMDSLGSQRGVVVTELLNSAIELNEGKHAARLNEIVRK